MMTQIKGQLRLKKHFIEWYCKLDNKYITIKIKRFKINSFKKGKEEKIIALKKRDLEEKRFQDMEQGNNSVNSQIKQEKFNQHQSTFQESSFKVPSCFKKIDDLYDDDQASLTIIQQLESLCIEEQIPDQDIKNPQRIPEMELEDSQQRRQYNQQNNQEQNIQADNKNSKFFTTFNKEINALTIIKYFTQEESELYQNEVRIITQLQDQSITLPLVSYGLKNNKLYYEQIAGQKDLLMLKEDLRAQHNNFLDFLLIKVFIKLEKMHNLGYSHSDIKPQNIVIGYDNEPYFIEFGGAVESNNFQDYFRQFTPLYNTHSYFQQKEGSKEYIKYNFQSIEETQYCDKLQLVLTCLYIFYCNDLTYKNIFKQKNFQKFRNEHNQSCLLDYLFNFLGLIKLPQKQQIQKIIKFILNNNTPVIKEVKDVEITTAQGVNSCILKRINHYSIHMIAVLVELFGQITLSDECTTIYFVPNLQEYQIIYTLYYYYVDYFQGIKNQKLKIQLNIYNNPQSNKQQIQFPQTEQGISKQYIYNLSIKFQPNDDSIIWIKFHVRYAIYHACKHFNLNKFTIIIYSLNDEYIEFFKELDTYNIKNTEIEIILMSKKVEDKYFQLFQEFQQKDKYKYKYLVHYKPDCGDVQNCSMQYVGLLSQSEDEGLRNQSEGIIKFIRFTDDIKQKKFYGVDLPEQNSLEEKRQIFNELFKANLKYQLDQQQQQQALKKDLIKKYNYLEYNPSDILGCSQLKVDESTGFELQVISKVK